MSQETIDLRQPEASRVIDGGLDDAYVFLERLVGWIALLLPFVLILGGRLFGVEAQSSLSAYYYTPVGGVFVGALCALGVFFLSYHRRPLPGHWLDNKLSDVASAAAIGVALLPTLSSKTTHTASERLVSTAHVGCAAALFVMLAVFALVIFRRSDQRVGSGGAYLTCGFTIVGVIALVIVHNLAGIFTDALDDRPVLLVLESIGVVAFGLAWLVKSGASPDLGSRVDPPNPEE